MSSPPRGGTRRGDVTPLTACDDLLCWRVDDLLAPALALPDDKPTVGAVLYACVEENVVEGRSGTRQTNSKKGNLSLFMYITTLL